MKLSNKTGYLTYGSGLSGLFLISPSSTEGYFDDSSLYACRESFAARFTKDEKYVGYAHSKASGYPQNLSIPAVAKFWAEIDGMLGTTTIIHETNFPIAIVVELDPFWTPNGTRRGFFTLLLRASVAYYDPDRGIDAALKAYPLAAGMINGVHYFLKGHTTPTYEEKYLGGGVYDKFHNKSAEQLQAMLVKFIRE